jgi:SAM-dependent methyltransferase
MGYWNDAFDDESAATYMETYGEGKNSPLRLKLASYLNNEDWVLDIGCGPGWNFDTFLENGPAVYYRGKDYSERFVKVANQRTGMNVFSVGDVRDFQEPDKSFDVVIMQDVLEHTNGYEKPVSEALRVARKRIIVTFWRLGDTDQTNDDGDDTWGSVYAKDKWEEYITPLGEWKHERLNRKDAFHDIYVIELEHGNLPKTEERNDSGGSSSESA